VKWDWRSSKALVRLSGPGLFNLRLFAWSYLFLFIPQILFDVVAFESSTWLWLPIWTLGHLLAGMAALLIRGLGLDEYLTKNPSLLLNLSIAALLGAIRVTFIGSISYELGLAPDFDLVSRIFNGAILGLVLFGFLASVLVSNSEYKKTLRKLLATQSQLSSVRKAKGKEIGSIQRDLEASTRAVIEPRLSAIATALREEDIKSASKKALANEIKDLLNNQIKPLSARLRSTSKAFSDPNTFRNVSRLGLLKIPDRIKPDLALQPLPLSVMLAALVPFAMYIFEGQQWSWLGFLLSGASFITIWLARAFFAPKPSIPTLTGILVLFTLVSMQALISNLILDVFGFPEESGTLVSWLIFLALFLTTAGYGLVATYEYNQETFLTALEKNNKRLERELALLNQRLWVEKRDWALRIHGSVQSSLTAALARLSRTGTVSPQEIKLIKQHIQQASKALKGSSVKVAELKDSLKIIRDTWKGIVKIELALKSDPALRVQADKWASACANEIIKESVSNSVKHGKAEAIKVRFEDSEPGFIQIVVEDNGKGLPAQFRPGLGSQLIDEIAYPWSLTKRPEGGATLRARIPVSRKSRVSKKLVDVSPHARD
jgi:two-component sensor histidine kinase